VRRAFADRNAGALAYGKRAIYSGGHRPVCTLETWDSVSATANAIIQTISEGRREMEKTSALVIPISASSLLLRTGASDFAMQGRKIWRSLRARLPHVASSLYQNA
jgi:hypothetical protein